MANGVAIAIRLSTRTVAVFVQLATHAGLSSKQRNETNLNEPAERKESEYLKVQLMAQLSQQQTGGTGADSIGLASYGGTLQSSEVKTNRQIQGKTKCYWQYWLTRKTDNCSPLWRARRATISFFVGRNYRTILKVYANRLLHVVPLRWKHEIACSPSFHHVCA